MCRFHEAFAQSMAEIMAKQLSWGHIIELLPLKYSTEREFYAYMTIIQKWNPYELRCGIGKALHLNTIGFQRLCGHYLEAINSVGSDYGALELATVMRDYYVLDFLGLPAEYSEHNRVHALLSHLEKTLLSNNSGFALVSRQRRMTIKDSHHWIDLVFYHRALKRIIAFDIKMNMPVQSFRQQMVLYLNWLKKYEYNEEENSPAGIIIYINHNTVDIEVCDIASNSQEVVESIGRVLPLNYLKGLLQSILFSFHK